MSAVPRRKLTTDEMAEAFYVAAKSLPMGVQLAVVERLYSDTYGVDAALNIPRDRCTRALTAIRAANAILGEPPSRKQFERMRAEHPEYDWPSAKSVIRWIGARNWYDALAQAGFATAAPPDLSPVRELGPAVSREELIDAVRRCARDLDRVPSKADYLPWAGRPDVQSHQERTPTSMGPFLRVFGSFVEALIAAGLITNAYERVGMNGRRTWSRATFSDEQILVAIRDSGDRVGRPPTRLDYTRDRDRELEAAVAEGSPRAIPSESAILRRFGKWSDALEQAGWPQDSVRDTRTVWCAARGMNDEAILDALDGAYKALGEPFTQTRYTWWRRREIDRDPTRAYELPSTGPIYHRFGGWRNAVVAMHQRFEKRRDTE